MLKQSQCQHIFHAPNLCTECIVPTFPQVYCWSTALRTPNTSHPIPSSVPWLSCFFLDVVGLFFLAFLGCLLPSANLFGFLFLLLWHLFLRCQSRLWLYHLVVPLLQHAPAKLVQLTPDPPPPPHPPYLTKHACSNIPT